VNLVVLIQGAVAMGCATASLFFLRFWRRSADRLFLRFAQAFVLLSLSYVLVGTIAASTEWQPYIFSVRLVAYGLIVFAIFEKNRR
jgi:hypothetical protein